MQDEIENRYQKSMERLEELNEIKINQIELSNQEVCNEYIADLVNKNGV